MIGFYELFIIFPIVKLVYPAHHELTVPFFYFLAFAQGSRVGVRMSKDLAPERGGLLDDEGIVVGCTSVLGE